MNKILTILLDRTRKILYYLSVFSIALMLVIIFLQVISRYLFNHSFEWSEELARFLFVWVVFIGSALIIGDKGHLAVKLLSVKLKGKIASTVLNVIIELCSLVFILILITQGGKMTKTMMFQTSPALGIPMGYVYSIIPISGVLMLLYFIKNILGIFGNNKASLEKE